MKARAHLTSSFALLDGLAAMLVTTDGQSSLQGQAINV